MKIHSIGLLSVGQLEKYKDLIPETNEKWWLRDSGLNDMFSAAATGKGENLPNGVVVRGEYCGVRPVVKLLSEAEPMTPGSTVRIGSRDFVALDKRLAIAKEPFEYSVYADGAYQNVFVDGEYRGVPNNYSHSLPLKIAREWARANEIDIVSPWTFTRDQEFARTGGLFLREMASAPGCVEFLKVKSSMIEDIPKEAHFGRIINIDRFAENPYMQDLTKKRFKEFRSAGDFIRMNPVGAAREMLDEYAFGIAPFSPTNYEGRGDYTVFGPMDYRVTDAQLRDFMKNLNIPERFFPPEKSAESRMEEDKGLDDECL